MLKDNCTFNPISLSSTSHLPYTMHTDFAILPMSFTVPYYPGQLIISKLGTSKHVSCGVLWDSLPRNYSLWGADLRLKLVYINYIIHKFSRQRYDRFCQALRSRLIGRYSAFFMFYMYFTYIMINLYGGSFFIFGNCTEDAALWIFLLHCTHNVTKCMCKNHKSGIYSYNVCNKNAMLRSFAENCKQEKKIR